MISSNKGNISVKGDTIGPWKLGETLGLGSTGKVQLAYNESTNQQAAIKVISKSVFSSMGNNSSMVSSTPDSLSYGIEREIIIMKLLNHPNVLRLYDVWETNNNLYMVLEYAEKGELFNLLVEKGPLPENEAIRFFRQIIIGMSYCHALGIVHRDLKPENILLDHKLNIKIADFGMAALETEDKLLETSCGSPHYAAPEIVSGLPYHGLETDVWSCGVILFALLTGRLPFDEEDGNIRNLLLKVQKGEFEMPGDDEISKEAQDLLYKILVVDPEKRIKSREILKHPLLQKYPSIKDSKTIRNLPREDTYLNPLIGNDGGDATIDKTILQNLVVLWHGRNEDDIAKKLREPGANAEKTLYALLYRFKVDSEQEALKNSQIKKRQSIISNNNLKSGNINTTTPQKKKNRNSVISVSSSHKRPVSLNRLSTIQNGKDVISVPSSSNTTPGSSKRISMSLSSNKGSKILPQSNSGSPTPAPRNKRMSVQNLETSSNPPPIPVDMLKDYGNSTSSHANAKRASRISKRLSVLPNAKRGSITTKIISTYAKLSEDDDWEFIEKETKRVSSDFATLIDEIFEHEKYEQIRKEKEELERKVRENKEREERQKRQKEVELAAIAREREELQRRLEEEETQITKELQQDTKNFQEDEVVHKNVRSISSPVENGNEAKSEEDASGQRSFSLQTRPVSKLDPGIKCGSNKPVQMEEIVEDELDKTIDSQKVILETIRRSKFLGSSFNIDKELKQVKKDAEVKRMRKSQKEDRDVSGRIVSETNEQYETQVLPKNATAFGALKDDSEEVEPRKISDIQVPQFTRKSKLFTDSNKRLSVLSIYSSTQSYTNLANVLKEGGVDIGVNEGSNNVEVSEEPEFQFETVGTEIENNKYEEEKEIENENNLSQGANIKLNYADRFDTAGNVNEVKLPTLPPLGDDKVSDGLGIYSSKSGSEGNESKPVPSIKENKSEETLKEKNVEPKPPLNDVVPKTRDTKKTNVVQNNNAKHSSDKPRSTSFFRKISKGLTVQNDTTGYDVKLFSNVSVTQLYNGLFNLLKGWKDYGLKEIKSNKEAFSISVRLSSDNILSLRSTFVDMVVFSEGKHSVIGFRKKSGSSKTLKRLTSEVEKVLRKEGVLAK
ncbi:hypothetical protein Kpol_2002p46 [Vanderwaltozyma polyspora DSM 70294]|uniref:non-specific serine/threonine protein kinase n=1 Tax=Vanderwaltozyma polyspora (strain ATCC 22028 / DSM 70294 / BCRC 21397 / CBS 2163 / NBRC 10782 / NRRL Y-8283 / UCD 57-17) TaxID=436907 RepID=A7TFG1_VANPO|nr:uncharacterized protein Kpol_2002p46 [Vanderwaltozyma polyspora DSM 70294]EDO18975.1 hypothetical protein Kpol_2002p46 [Vanderwaltozyma polyspora DSM 70294]